MTGSHLSHRDDLALVLLALQDKVRSLRSIGQMHDVSSYRALGSYAASLEFEKVIEDLQNGRLHLVPNETEVDRLV